MIIFLFLSGILTFFLLGMIIFFTIKIKIDIVYLKIMNKKNIDLDSIKYILDECDKKSILTKKQIAQKIKDMIFNIEYKVKIHIYIFNKLKIFSFTIDNVRAKYLLGKFSNSNISKKFNFKINKKMNLEAFFRIFSKLSQVKVNVDISTESPIFTSILTTLLNGIIAIVLTEFYRKQKIQNIKNCNYKVVQINDIKNRIDINFSCIIELKSVNIINIYKILNKERKIKSGKSSNRKSNEKCYG